MPEVKAIVSMGRGGCGFAAAGAVAWLAGVNPRPSPTPPTPTRSMSSSHHRFWERGDGGGVCNSSRFETETWESEVGTLDTPISRVNV
ncbi:hypothetical protein DSM107010_22330 [Chroococcidiopsis cubana SAG 39.79]|uniref:Uncharacterized protein n=1 Tax=Chroococcidiopsis cubana SAG 39.79 TaxID=388085 RepID=A0AB37UMB9_9CYAN|nr:hypothetical protein DSM107010_22330 [Chroococcidiopsis cubana SAG 39.79]